KQMVRHALPAGTLEISDSALRHIVTHYAREAGVRNLEKQLARICRKLAYRIAMGRSRKVALSNQAEVEKMLGLPPFQPEEALKRHAPGVAMGLAWTQFGGDTLFVESLAVDGKGGIVLTGTLGKVMQESANLAYTYVRDRARGLPLSQN